MISDSDTDTNLHTITINEHFAKAFEYKKEREELARLEEKYGSNHSELGSDVNESEDSEVTEEDSDGEELTPAMDAAILRTLAMVKKKDPAIYEGGRRVFEEEHTRTQDKAPAMRSKTKEKSKPLTIREAALASTLANATPHSRSSSVEPLSLTHTEEQVLLRSETLAAFHGAVESEGEGDDDDLLIPRSRTRDEIEMEEEEYRAFLEREVGEDIRNLVTVGTDEAVGVSNGAEITGDDNKKQKKKKGKRERGREREEKKEEGEAQVKRLAEQRNKTSKEEADHEFLMNYIFNRGWIDHSNRRVPTYDEIVESSSKHSKRKLTDFQAGSDGNDNMDKKSDNEQLATLSDEDSFEDLADAFETSYNFRFEEPGGALIASFPRSVPSARRETTTRKDARARKRDRQETEKRELLESRREEIRRERVLAEAAVAQEDEDAFTTRQDTDPKKSKKQQRKEELARLKALKTKELRRKLEMVSSEGGLGGLGDEALVHLDLHADWDPSKHDAQMAELYGGDDGFVDDDDMQKPIWDDDINIDDIEIPNAKTKAELKKQKKKEKKKDRKVGEGVGVDEDEMDADAVWDEWDEEEGWRGTEEERKRKVDAYMDEVVNRLGFSSITSHMPTRFHYTSTAPENYGLTSAEILLATDAELNSYVGLKKLAPYRDKEGKSKKSWDPERAQRLKDFREQLHSRMGSNYEGAWSLRPDTKSKNKTSETWGEKKKRRGKKERAKLKAMQGENDGGEENAQADKLQKRKREPDVNLQPASNSGETEVDMGDGSQKRRRKRRHKKRTGEADEIEGMALS